MTIYDLITISILVTGTILIVSHVNISRKARIAAKQHCEQNNLQFLDQNVILEKMRICRSRHQLFAISRQYRFEFSSLGDQRYQGRVIAIGNRINSIKLDAYKTQNDC